MDNGLDSLLVESTKLELQVAELYSLFHESFPNDAAFWGRLMLEEINHASLLRSVEECFKPLNLLPHGLVAPALKDLQDINGKLHDLINKYREAVPSRDETFKIAFELEQSAGEFHFQKFMDSSDVNSKVDNLFRRLNMDDRDHARRIYLYMESQGIRVHGLHLDRQAIRPLDN